ncbi:MAG: hypothetical protein WKG01_29990 [Kofleriaceae bacterium]
MKLVLAMVLIGCGGSRPPPQQPAPELPVATRPTEAPRTRCGKAVANVVDKTRANMAADGFTDAAIEHVRTSATESCDQKQWSVEVLDCYDQANTVQAVGTCQDKLTEDQRGDLQQRMNTVATEHKQP